MTTRCNFQVVKGKTKRFMDKNIKKLVLFHSDKGGRRSGSDRRRFSYSNHIPERRCAGDRRSGKDRRMGNGTDGRKCKEPIKSLDLRRGEDLRTGIDGKDLMIP